jgi:ribonuclease-3
MTSTAFTCSQARQYEIDQLLSLLGLSPTTQHGLYHQALTHSSFTYENKSADSDNYERLEFLGDAVLKLCISQILFDRFPEYREGDLTKIRAVIVSDATLAELARELQLGDYMVFGASERRSGGAEKTSSLACAFEALLGALFLDGKMPDIQRLLDDLMVNIITEVDLNKTKDNFKAVLQEYSQGEGLGLPDYHTLSESGPSHNRVFEIGVSINGELLGRGMGKNKKAAQQEAAKEALFSLGVLEELPNT